ncbi:myelin-associated glycoprotein-like [Sinocyclocheilus anshuiensis]|uniref:myelin-associated glycoprotein-like n=1 Tax=Sinocyclocheilus anshuiensis TaxID=1608454 RepID=UPI0007BAD589|nr:PREDICTED: myelin-associated glycoprotein-like [Sinocyclocheilus anshuiensis]
MPESVVGLSVSCLLIPCTFSYPANGKTYTEFTGIWYKGSSIVYHTDTSKIIDSFKGRTLIGDLRQNDCSLKISSLSSSDAGPFEFRIEIKYFDNYSYGEKVSITVKETPENPTVSVEEEVTSVKQVTATCAVSHSCPSDLPRVSWSHDGSHSSPSQPQNHGQWKLTSYSLTFTPSREDNNKRLSCSAEFKGKTVTGYKTLKVKYPPYNVNVLTKSSVKENDSVELTCSSNSNPPANSYQWFSSNGKRLAENPTYKLEKVSRHTEAISCTAINTEGKNSSGPQKINVLYPPYNVNVVTKSSVKENDSVELTCSSNSNPPANSYQWFSSNGKRLAENPTYKLEKVSRHTEAISCTAINTEGKNSSGPQKLNILYPPEIKSESSCQSKILTACVCIVDSNPPSEVKWFGPDSLKAFSSTSIKQNESLTIFTLQGWLGFPETIQCFANNSLGSSSITLEAPQNGIIYIAVASAVAVVLVCIGVCVVRRRCRNRAAQQPVMKNEQTQMKTTQNKSDFENSKEEEGSDGDIYTNCPDSHVYDNWGCDKRPLSSDRALEDEAVYANM